MYPGRNPEEFSGEESNGGEKCEYIRIRSGKTISEIADALEESEAEIQRLIEEMNK